MSVHRRAGKTISQKITEFIGRTKLESVPPQVREAAKLHLLDGLAAMLGGVKEESSRLLRLDCLLRGTKAEASVLGTPNRVSAEHAALLNGVQGHVLDYDDAQLATLGSRPLGQQTHPTTPVLAAALALAESRRANGSALLAAYIVGVEVACRLGDAVDPSHYLDGFHPTGTLGAFGAAAACARLLNLQPRSIRHALGIAGTLASGLRANRGTMAKGLNAGRAAENGLLAARLASGGFTASENIFDESMGFFSAMCRSRVDVRLLRFGKPLFFFRPGVAVKLYPCAGVLHPALDVTLELRERYGIEAQSIDRIRVALDAEAALPLVYKIPQDSLQAKFSLHFAVAAAMVDGAAGLRQFAAARLRDSRIQDLMRRIELVRRPASTRTHKLGIDTEVEIALKRGPVHRSRAAIARGHPSRPASRGDIEEKFGQCAAGILPPGKTTKFLKNFSALERTPSIAAWLQPLRPAGR
ncbi:MAG: MmgE/PrpD family protein [Candidatus Binatia bacterium]